MTAFSSRFLQWWMIWNWKLQRRVIVCVFVLLLVRPEKEVCLSPHHARDLYKQHSGHVGPPCQKLGFSSTLTQHGRTNTKINRLGRRDKVRKHHKQPHKQTEMQTVENDTEGEKSMCAKKADLVTHVPLHYNSVRWRRSQVTHSQV